MSSPQWHFADFRLDLDNACLWRGMQRIALTPKAFDVLHYLVTHADRLVTKDTLLDAVWPETAISDAVVRIAIGELRRALGDTPQAPRFIATVHRRGYRFLATVSVADTAENTAASASPPASLTPAPPPLLVGREAMLQRLGEAWAQACQGQRQVVWVTGEAGMGKTTVVEVFRAAVATDAAVWLAAGQCVEHYGTGEAYLPVLEALGQLCRGVGGEGLVTLLRQHAPTWLVQMPWLLTEADRQQLRDELQGVTRERMLREFAEVVDTLTAQTPLLLVFEDLHWSDYATLDLLALLARRQTPAHLLVVGTYRPVETMVRHHPLRIVVQDLQRHGRALDLPLTLLNAKAVAAYLAARFPRQQFPAALVLWLHQRTDGQPLFLVTLVQALVEQGVLYERDGCWTAQEGIDTLPLEVPESLRQLLEQQITRLPSEAQRVLEVASVAGVDFVAAAVAAGLEADVTTVEEHCEALGEQQMLRSLAVTTWPDGTVATRYAFVHALYQQVVYERLGAGRRVRLHQRLGECLEKAYEAQAGEIAAELAEHFVRGQDTQRAVHYLHLAAENALHRLCTKNRVIKVTLQSIRPIRSQNGLEKDLIGLVDQRVISLTGLFVQSPLHRCAHVEAISHLTRGLELLTTVPETPKRLQHEIDLLVPLGAAWAQARGWSAPEVGQAYARARALCERLGEPPQLPVVLLRQFMWCVPRAEWQTAHALGEHLHTLAQRQSNPVFLLSAHIMLGVSLVFRGEVAAAHAHFAQGSTLYVPAYHRAPMAHHGIDLGVHARCYAALSLWLLGAPEQALAQMHEARTLAQELAHPYSLAFALSFVTFLHQWRRDIPATLTWAEAVLALSAEHGFGQYFSYGRLLHGWALMARGQGNEGLDQMGQGLTAYQATATSWLPYFLAILAERYGQLGAANEGLQVLAEALAAVQKTGECIWEAELHRLKGRLVLQAQHQSPALEGGMLYATDCTLHMAEAEACLHQALTIARRQQAKSLELRAAMSLARLWQHQGKRTEARELLAPIYSWFTEGFDTADIQDAKALLEDLRA
jgi:predicted ATPase/DNA-binding winged helix-turn-helix (wHTH) protein